VNYDAYGNATSETQPANGDNLKFAAYWFEAWLGLHQVKARWYSPSDGCFISEDPLGLEADSNPNRYAGNEPTDATDPSGEITILLHGIRDKGTKWMQSVANGIYSSWVSHNLADKDNPVDLQICLGFTWAGKGAGGKPSLIAAKSSTRATMRNSAGKAAVALLKTFVNDLRGILPKGEPINILAHSQGTMVTLAALQQGMKIDNAVFLNSCCSIEGAKNEFDKAFPNVTGKITHYWSKRDKAVVLVNGSRKRGPNKPLNIEDGDKFEQKEITDLAKGHGDSHTAKLAKDKYGSNLESYTLTKLRTNGEFLGKLERLLSDAKYKRIRIITTKDINKY
jgi:RHS repeat-associated protein